MCLLTKYALKSQKVKPLVMKKRHLNFILALKERGCKFALDDFGTGFSSYVNLRQVTRQLCKS